jgi:hypothetical protein
MTTESNMRGALLSPLEQQAVNAIAANHGCGARTKTELKEDNMTWFLGKDLMAWLGISLQKAGGLMVSLDRKNMIQEQEKRKVIKGEERARWVLTDTGIDASDFPE